MWNSIVVWFKSKGGFVHVTAVVFLFLVGAYDTSPQVKTYFTNLYNALPGWLEQIVLLGFALYQFYKDPASGQLKKLRSSSSNKLAVWALISLLLIGTIPLAGCTVTAAEIQADGADIAQALNNVATAEQAINPVLAQKLQAAATGVLQATENFKIGGAVNVVNDALTATEVVLAVIPQTAPISVLIPIAEAAIDTLIENLPGSSANASVKLMAINNPYLGYKIHHRFGRSLHSDFKADWNEMTSRYPSLAPLALK